MDLLQYWEKALEAKHGWRIETPDVRRLTTYLYEARKGHPEFTKIRICHPAGGGVVFLTKEDQG
jgi:hypothetical protein